MLWFDALASSILRLACGSTLLTILRTILSEVEGLTTYPEQGLAKGKAASSLDFARDDLELVERSKDGSPTGI